MHFSQKVWEIETLFVLQTYRKSYMGFYLVPWPLTSDAPNDLEMSNMHFSRKPWEIETSVVLESYRKSYMNFLLMPWPLISDAPNDLEMTLMSNFHCHHRISWTSWPICTKFCVQTEITSLMTWLDAIHEFLWPYLHNFRF